MSKNVSFDLKLIFPMCVFEIWVLIQSKTSYIYKYHKYLFFLFNMHFKQY